MVPC